ncbi:MAG: dodecin domain-containing protein [Solirubrobacterales bacterium]|nr:dodecin domain-containing protein [Solirubrobacterales bacterium]MBV9943663.1 dodecin domain-containing protein [Solirubrobacterales bacterium]
MAVTKIIELVGSSTTSSDDAVKAALAEAQASLRNIKAVDVVSVGLRGAELDEWRALVRISFLIERVSE